LDRRLAADALVLAALVASAALFDLAGPLPLSLAGLALFVVLSWARIDLGLAAVVVLLPYFGHPKTVLAHHPFPPSEWLLGVETAVAVGIVVASALGFSCDSTADPARWRDYLRPPRPQWNQLRTSPFLLPASVFLLAAAISTAAAAERRLATRELLEVVIEPVLFFVLLLVFTPIHSDARRRRSLLVVGVSLVLAGMGASLIAAGQLVTRQHLVSVSAAAYKRVPGPYFSPDNLGLLLDRAIPMALALALAPATVVKLWSRAGCRSRLARFQTLPAIGFVLMGLVLVATFVLGAWLGTAIAVLAVLLVKFRPGWWVVAPAVVVLAAGLALGLGKAHSVTAGNRVDIWQSAIRMIHDHPILGIGPDNFQHYYAPVHGDNVGPNARWASGRCYHGLGYMEQAAHSEPCLSHPHDEFLDFWLSTGIAGLAAFIWLQAVFWRIIWRRRNELGSLPVLLGAGTAMLASLLHGLVDNSYFLVDLSLIMWVLFGVASLSAIPMSTEDRATLRQGIGP